MNFKYPFYHQSADPVGVAEMLPILREFYTRYPTGLEMGEALHQLRRELDLIVEVTEKRRKIKELSADLESADLDEETDK